MKFTDGKNVKINPEYLKATHVVLWMYRGAPSFEEQIRRDQQVQEQLEKEMRDSANDQALRSAPEADVERRKESGI